MKVAIISDIHDNLINLERVLSTKHDALICCGDVTNAETLEYLAKGFTGPIHLVRGNICIFDGNDQSKFKNIIYYGEVGRFELDGHWVGLCHEPSKISQVLRLGPCEHVFFGHTHKPWEEARDGVHCLNPGTLGGVFMAGTYAVWETDDNRFGLERV